MTTFDRALPPLLAEVNAMEYDYADGEGIDFEPYEQFQSAEENADWIHAWTGNEALDGAEYRIFGQDGTGGLAAIWLARDGAPLLDQPIVFFGSEGELGVVAKSFGDYLWILAGGHGPLEAVEYPGSKRTPTPHFAAFAEKHAPRKKQTVTDVVAAAKTEFPSFAEDFRAKCKHG
jgi:hypothetical protein